MRRVMLLGFFLVGLRQLATLRCGRLGACQGSVVPDVGVITLPLRSRVGLMGWSTGVFGRFWL